MKLPADTSWQRFLITQLSVVALMITVLAVQQRVAFAQAKPIKMSQQDIIVELDPAWTEVRFGGYYPLRMTVQNRGPDCRLRFAISDRDEFNERHISPTIHKDISLTQNATTKLTLLIPIVSEFSSGQLEVTKDGRLLDQIGYSYGGAPIQSEFTHSLLSIAVGRPDFRSFELFVQGDYRGGYGSIDASVENIVPSSAPDTWMAYTGVDVVSIDAESFRSRLSNTQRDELLRWVKTGGNLLIYNVSQLASGRDTLDKVIGWESTAATNEDWKSATMASLYPPNLRPEGDTKDLQKKHPIEIRQLMFGRIVATDSEPFAQGRQFWQRIYDALGRRNYLWIQRHGFSPRFEANDFLDFVIAGIQIIPTWGFIVLITLFSIVIGPVNYLLLRKKNKIGQLLWTTPAIALVTCVALLGYSAIANGTSSRVRLRSFTKLDQKSQTAVSITRAAMFSGIAPRQGLRFQPNSAVYPIWQEYDAFQVGHVDWTDAQVLTGSFHRGNTRSQFLITTPRTERGRIEVGEAISGTLPITNGLEWNIERIVLRDKNGDYYSGTSIGAGDKVSLKKAASPQIEAFRNRIGEQEMSPPRLMGTRPPDFSYYHMGSDISTDFATGQLENYMGWLERDLGEKNKPELQNQSYVAVLSEPPSLDLGLTSFSTTEELHVLHGFY